MMGIALDPHAGRDPPRDRLRRIAMVAACPFPARRGTPLRVERLAEALWARGHAVEVLTYHIADPPQGLPFPVHRIFDRTVDRRMAVGPSLGKLLAYDPALAYKLARVLAAAVAAGRPFEIIHAHHYEGLLAGLFARHRQPWLPVVYDAHTMLASELPTYRMGLGQRLARTVGAWLDGALPRRADHVVAVTEDIRHRLIGRHGLEPGRVSVVMNGVEVERFAAAAAGRLPRAAPATGEGVAGPGGGWVLYSGTLAPYQNIDLLLEAFALAHRLRPRLRLYLSVSSPLDGYRERASRLGIANAIDVQADDYKVLPERLAAATVAVLPRTRCDGIPQKLLNYMAAGSAVVASAGSAKVLDHERTGLVVPNGDAAAFARAIVRLVDDHALAAALGRNARAFVERHCTWDAAAEGCERVYARLLQGEEGADPAAEEGLGEAALRCRGPAASAGPGAGDHSGTSSGSRPRAARSRRISAV